MQLKVNAGIADERGGFRTSVSCRYNVGGWIGTAIGLSAGSRGYKGWAVGGFESILTDAASSTNDRFLRAAKNVTKSKAVGLNNLLRRDRRLCVRV